MQPRGAQEASKSCTAARQCFINSPLLSRARRPTTTMGAVVLSSTMSFTSRGSYVVDFFIFFSLTLLGVWRGRDELEVQRGRWKDQWTFLSKAACGHALRAELPSSNLRCLGDPWNSRSVNFAPFRLLSPSPNAASFERNKEHFALFWGGVPSSFPAIGPFSASLRTIDVVPIPPTNMCAEWFSALCARIGKGNECV